MLLVLVPLPLPLPPSPSMPQVPHKSIAFPWSAIMDVIRSISSWSYERLPRASLAVGALIADVGDNRSRRGHRSTRVTR
jgi:hypothetical protein